MRVDEQPVAPGDRERPAYVLDLIRDRVVLHGLRVLDLACRAGAFSTVLADAGAQVLGVEGRIENLTMAPARPTLRYALGDVRDLSRERHGTFDVTLCLGILYHLDAADALALLRAMRDVTEPGGFAIVDTHVGEDQDVVWVGDRPYRGHRYSEPSDGWWSAIGNPSSWWFTPESLDDALTHAGWTTLEHLPGVRWPGEPPGRHWLVAS